MELLSEAVAGMCQHGALPTRPTGFRKVLGQSVSAGLIALLAPLTPVSAATLSAVKTVYLAGLGTKPGAAELAKRLAAELEKTAGLRVVKVQSEADATLEGEGEIWTRGYISLNPRSGTGPGHGQPIYGGSLSVEMRGADHSVLWSYLATPHSGAADTVKDLARQVAKGLKAAREKEH